MTLWRWANTQTSEEEKKNLNEYLFAKVPLKKQTNAHTQKKVHIRYKYQ